MSQTSTPLKDTEEIKINLQLMHHEMMHAHPIYQASISWQNWTSSLETTLLQHTANFKRLFNPFYCNFFPRSHVDPLMTHLNAYHVDLIQGNFTIQEQQNTLGPWSADAQEMQKELYLQYVARMYEYGTKISEHPALETLSEPILGNPIKIFRNQRLISQDLVTSLVEANVILKALETRSDSNARLSMAEFGAGYGRLAYVFLRLLPCRYFIFDIPPALGIAQWYLSTLFPDRKIMRFRHFDSLSEVLEELNQADIAFFTPNQLELFPRGYFDVFTSIASMHEMSRVQINHYLQLMANKTKNVLYLKQYWRYLNPHENLELTEADYRLPLDYMIWRKIQSPLNPYFFEIAAVYRPKKVSVLLCNYNHAHYLPEALMGIFEQTLKPFEVIIVDDGSTDNSLAVIKHFMQQYPAIGSEIVLLTNETNRGLIYSFHRAFQQARGDYIVWAASDDKLLPRFIERNIEMLQQYPEAGLSFSRLTLFRDDETGLRFFTEDSNGPVFDLGIKPHYLSPGSMKNRLKRSHLWISANTVMARRDLLSLAHDFPEDLRWHTDWFTFYALALRFGACVIPETLALLRDRPGTYSKVGMSDPKQQQKVLNAMAKYIHDENHTDIYELALQCPSIFSIFGFPMAKAFFSNIRYWKMGFRYWLWFSFVQCQYHYYIFNKILQGFKKLWKKIAWPEN